MSEGSQQRNKNFPPLLPLPIFKLDTHEVPTQQRMKIFLPLSLSPPHFQIRGVD